VALLKKILPLVALIVVVLPAGSAMAAQKSKFRFEKPTYVATEGQGTLTVTVTRTARHGHSRVNQASSVNYSVTGGSATQGSDYTLSPDPGKLTFASDETTKTITVTINQDSEIEGLETINLKLSAASSNALITSPRTSQVLIADDDGPTQVQLAPASQSVNESVGNAQFFAVRSGDITGSSSVHYASADGTNADDTFNAHAANDYASTSGDFTFAPAEFSKPINVPVVDDSLPENPEDFGVTLSNLLGAKFPNDVSTVTASATIVDNDSAPRFQLDASSYEVNEDGSVDVTVQRLSSATAALVSANDVFNVNWATTDGTATNPADYIPGPDQQLEFDSTDDAETITIAANDADTQIGLVNDTVVEGDEMFGLALTSANNAGLPGNSGIDGSLGTPSSANVTIHDNDVPPSNVPANPAGGSGAPTGSGAVLGNHESTCGLVVKATKAQKLLKQKGLKLQLRSSQNCKVGLATTIKQLKPKSKKRQAQIVRALVLKGKQASLTLAPGTAKTVTVTFTKKTLAAIRKALRARKQLVATVVVTERDSASTLERRTLKITIRR
jgi:hypothetical protein